MERRPADHPRVHFSGPWSAKSRERLARALHAFDERHALGEPSPYVGRPWIAIKHEMGSRDILFVSRSGIKHPFSGTSLDEIISLLQSDSFPEEPSL